MTDDIERVVKRLFAEAPADSPAGGDAFVARVSHEIRRRRRTSRALAMCGGAAMAVAAIFLAPPIIETASRVAHIPGVVMQQAAPLLVFPLPWVAYFFIAIAILSRSIAR